MKVLKFGGTSVGSVKNIRHVVSLINNDEPKFVVLSAMSGTTNKLVEIANCHKSGNIDKAQNVINELREKYMQTADELLTSSLKDIYFQFCNNLFETLSVLIRNDYTSHIERIIQAQGEICTTHLVQLYLKEINVNSILLPALNFMKIQDDGEPDYPFIESQIKKELQDHLGYQIYLTQGFICKNPNDEIDNLKRGGSDYTATILGAMINAREIEIWSDIDGLHNNDPRFVENTQAVDELTFDEAEELAYFGAKVLHPTCIFPAKWRNVPVRLKNTMNPQAQGTYISSNEQGYGIKAIAAKDCITAIQIKSGRMLNAYGFLRRIFEIFEQFRTSVDMITTSEVSVSVTIDNTSKLEEIIAELNTLGNVEIIQHQSLICVVGFISAQTKGIANKILESLTHLPIRMISYGSSGNNVTLLIDSDYKIEALNSLHNHLFLKPGNGAHNSVIQERHVFLDSHC